LGGSTQARGVGWRDLEQRHGAYIESDDLHELFENTMERVVEERNDEKRLVSFHKLKSISKIGAESVKQYEEVVGSLWAE
jgi:hypothetical protein